jgi:hypothetical protein
MRSCPIEEFMIAVKNLKASEEVASLIARADPAKVIAFRPSRETRERVSELIEREKNERLSAEELSELDYYMQLEHLMRMAKIYARKYSSGK